jgi:hypothetical protein
LPRLEKKQEEMNLFDVFVLDVARFLEANDDTLLPLREKIITQQQQQPSLYPSVDNEPRGNYEEYLHATTAPQPTAPTDTATATDASTTSTTRVIRETHIVRESTVGIDSSLAFLALASHGNNTAPTTVVNVNNNNGEPKASSRQQQQGGEVAKDDKEETKTISSNRWLGAALIAGSTVATTVVIGKALRRSKAFNRLLQQRKMWFQREDERACEFLQQFDRVADDFKTSNRLTKGSAAAGGASAAILGSLYYFSVNSGVAYFPFVLLGCVSLGAATVAYYAGRDVEIESRKLHAACKKWLDA